jgi:hypothetical protein
MPKGAGTMPQNEEQARVGLKRLGDLSRQISQPVQPGCIRPRLVRDQRATQFEKDQFLHRPVLPQTDFPSMAA